MPPSTSQAKPNRIEQLMTLLRLMGEAQEVSSLAASLHSVAEMAALLTHSQAAGVFVSDETTRVMRLVASYGAGLASSEHSGVLPLKNIPWATGRESRFVRRDEDQADLSGAPEIFRNASYWVPMVRAGETVGRLVVAGRKQSEIGGTELEFLRLIAIYATTMIGSVRLHHALTERVAALTTLAEVGQAITSTLDVDRVLRQIVEGVARLCGASACSIMLLDDGRQELRIRMAIGVPEEVVRTAVRKIGEGFSGKVALTGEPIFLRDVNASKDQKGCNPDRYKRPSLIVVPLNVRGLPIGVLNVNDKKDGDFTTEDYNLITLFANQAAVAIDNARMHDQLWKTSVTDGLTQAYVQTYFKEQLGRLVEAAKARQGRIALIMVDIDHFKNVNDKHGHRAGDVVLQGVAALLRRAVRANDLVARYGGEEFALVLSDVPSRIVLAVAERLRKAVENTVFPCDGVPIWITASFGVAVLPFDADSADSLIKVSDEFLYASKRGGRNRVTCSDQVRVTAEREQSVAFPAKPQQ